MYFGVYTFTDNTDATALVNKKNAGVYVAGIVDQYSNTSSGYTTLQSGLGSTKFKTYTNATYIYHSKYMIVDPSNVCSDPLVLTGSHNWTITADTKNDENTLIIHDATIANIYYQAFHKDFYSLGGTLTIPSPCITTAIENIHDATLEINIYPNPANGSITIELNNEQMANGNYQLSIYNVLGQLMEDEIVLPSSTTKTVKQINVSAYAKGIYTIIIENNGTKRFKKLIVN